MSPERIQYGHVNSKYEVIGTATLTVTAASEPSPYSTRWQESISVFAGAMSPISPGTRLSLRSTCTECIKGPPAWGDGPAQRTRISYEGEALSINTTPVITHGNWAGPLLCCDGRLGQHPGCIATDDLAKATISKFNYGPAAIAHEWAQKSLSNNNNMGTDKRRGGDPFGLREDTESIVNHLGIGLRSEVPRGAFQIRTVAFKALRQPGKRRGIH